MRRQILATFGATFLAVAALFITAPDTAPAPDAATLCADHIAAELDTLAESAPGDAAVIVPSWDAIRDDCERLGPDAAYVANVGPTLPPCVWEDGSGGPLPCFWDAANRGNGLGASYIVTS